MYINDQPLLSALTLCSTQNVLLKVIFNLSSVGLWELACGLFLRTLVKGVQRKQVQACARVIQVQENTKPSLEES